MTEDTAANPPAPLWGRMLCTWLSARQNSDGEVQAQRSAGPPGSEPAN
jgi:hypothetical protein